MRRRQLPITWVAGAVAATALVVIGLQGLPTPVPRAVDAAPPAEPRPAPPSSLAGTTPHGAAPAAADHA
ncbi:MAG: hypothetical protein H7276_09605, partial [Caulobacter sp.]|nr:hypothetical protein [Vitreoscilla sp.]